MERHAPWFQLLAVALVVVGLATLAAPAPAHAMDPQLILALASTAGAIALIVGYLIVANGRESKRAASLEGIYACGNSEADGPMGCGGPAKPTPAAASATPESPMVADDRSAPRLDAPQSLARACPGSQAAGPMGCSGPMDSEPLYSTPAPAAAESSLAVSVQGQ
jgi:hypothetical protein